jgi:hypothetical protein
MCTEFFFGQVTFKAPAFFAVGVQDEDGRCPECVETPEVFGIFLDVNAKRDEVLVDERRQTGVAVRLVFEPLTGTSIGCRAEIDQERFVLLLSLV